MTDKPNLLADLLGHLVRAAAKLSREDIDAVLEGKKRITIAVESKRPPEPKDRHTTKANMSDVLARLKAATSREQAAIVLEESKLVRADLVSLAQSLDFPVQKNDDVARLKEKLIEATIGFKLRSRAIQG